MPDPTPTTPAGGTPATTPATTPVDFSKWLESQSAEIKTAYQTHLETETRGLKTALGSERAQRGDLEKQVRDLAKGAEKGSDAEKRLTELADKLSAAEAQQDFYDQAHKVGVTDLKLAYIVAREEGLINAKGRVDFEELKKSHPALFGVAQPAGKADGGAGKKGGTPAGMNEWIRKEAGR